jgi:dTDP-4-dehydrorhamnose 3,5-epimerase
MQVIDTAIPDVKILKPAKHGDDRGFFSETFSSRALRDAGLVCDFVQDNQSLSVQPGVVRGLHYQLPPAAQDKLVRVIRGAIVDVAVDIRRGSPTFGQHVAVELSAENWRQLLVPKGFAHGFATLVPNTEVFYKVTAFYSPQHDRGIRWNDPALKIDWRIDPATAILSGKDQQTPLLAEAAELF